MPKMKSKRAAVKRLKVTATGKLKRYHCNAGHILTKKAQHRKRRLRQSTLVGPTQYKRMRRLIVD